MLKVFEAFSGVGSQRMALRNIGVQHEVVAIAEIDKYALASYESIHGDCPNLGDISKLTIDQIPNHDLFTYSFPCQDISIAGKGKGLSEGTNTRSSLLWECKRVIEGKRPRYLLLENVKNLVGKKNKPDFDKWLEWLESQGYTNYWKIINAKHHGIPQNRERVFVVSILGEHLDYEFPDNIELDKCLGDLLEPEVDEKYFLSQDVVDNLIYKSIETKGYDQIIVVGNTNPSGKGMNGQVYDISGLAPTLTTNKGEGNRILIKNATRQGYLEAENGDGIDLAFPDSKTRRGRVQKGLSQTLTTSDNIGVLVSQKTGVRVTDIACCLDASYYKGLGCNQQRTGVLVKGCAMRGRYNEDGTTGQHLEVRKDDVSNTITTVQKDYLVLKDFAIRKLTPRECWRLMGFTDTDFDKAAQKVSNSQLYKQAGNSIVVNVLEGIFKNLFL